jgi:hypothetical protein
VRQILQSQPAPHCKVFRLWPVLPLRLSRKREERDSQIGGQLCVRYDRAACMYTTLLLGPPQPLLRSRALQAPKVPRDCGIRAPHEVLATSPVGECRGETVPVRILGLLCITPISGLLLCLQHTTDLRVRLWPLFHAELAPEAGLRERLPARSDVLNTRGSE